VWPGNNLLSQGFIAELDAPDLSPADKETLFWGKTSKGLLWLIFGGVLVSAERHC
jgi:hypothetical protein